MKHKCVLVFFIATFIGLSSEEDENIIDKNIKFDLCTDQDTGKEYRVGDIWTASSQCLGKNCGQTSQGNYTIGYISCPIYQIPSGCYLSAGDLREKFPRCCPQPQCPKVLPISK